MGLLVHAAASGKEWTSALFVAGRVDGRVGFAGSGKRRSYVVCLVGWVLSEREKTVCVSSVVRISFILQCFGV